MDLRFVLLLLCFLLSGFSALLYQTAWAREFAFVFGTSEVAIAAVLAGYMGGLALGSALAARIAPRLTRPVLAYGILELGIAAGALAIPLEMRGLTAVYVAGFGGGDVTEPGAIATAFRLLGAFALLLPPTALMGATLPLLARQAIRRDEQIGPRIGALYAINTAGAIGGTLCAAFLLLPALGLRQTIYLGALLNGVVFVAAAGLARGAMAPIRPAAEVDPRPEARWILPLVAVSGAVSFTYEVLWTRLLSQLLGSSLHAFATMLASFLLGIALGSAAGGRSARRAERAATGFAVSQLGICLLAVAAFAASDRLPDLAARLGTGGLANPLALAPIAVAVLLPVALCIGATFPLAVRVTAPGAEGTARATARVYAWNTVGAIAGAIGAGFVLLPRIGFAGTVRLGCATSLALAVATCLCARPRLRAPLVAAGALAAVLVLLPVRTPWRLLRSAPLTSVVHDGPARYYAVGRSSTVLLLENPGDFTLYTNGLPEARVTKPDGVPGRARLAHWLGLLPVLLKPDSERLLVIGLGGGTALEGIPPGVERVDVVELEPEVVAANRRIGAERALDPLAEPRTRVCVNDARGALMLSDRRYDAIVSQPSHPWTAGASHLYTREFFELARDHLVDDGVFVQWIGLRFVDEGLLRSLVATFTAVFPFVQVYQPVPTALLFAGSRRPHPLGGDPAALAASPDHFARHDILSIEDAASALVLDDAGARALAGGAAINSDDRNLLASRSALLGRAALTPPSLHNLLAGYDPLPALADRLDRVELVNALARRGSFRRAEALAGSFPEPDRDTAQGYLDLAQKRPRSAGRHFHRALELAPRSLAVLAGAALAGMPASPDPPAPIATLRRALALERRGDATELAALDADLAVLARDPLLSDATTDLRVAWRLRSGDPARGAEALALLDRELHRADQPAFQLRRAEAARLAGQPQVAWVTLDDVSRRLLKRGGAGFARQALALADRLPDHPLAMEIRERLRHGGR